MGRPAWPPPPPHLLIALLIITVGTGLVLKGLDLLIFGLDGFPGMGVQ